ncbi:MAG: glycosyltransferase [Bacteroidota bacterium]
MIALLVNSLVGGGAERVVLTLFNEFRTQGIEVELILIEKEQFYDLPEGIQISYLTEKKSIKGNFSKGLNVYTAANKLKEIVEKRNISVVQSHLVRASYINILAKMFGARHKVQVVNHGLISYSKSRGIRGRANIVLSRMVYNHADSIVSISKVMRMELQKLFNIKGPEKHVMIYNPHNIDNILSRSYEEPTFAFDPEKKYLITVGRLVDFKRLDVIIRSFREVKEVFPMLELLIIGDGEERSTLENLTQTLQIGPYVHFLGYQKNPFSLMARSDLYVMASEMEGLPNILIEAMICGIPVIASDCQSGPRELLQPGEEIYPQDLEDIELGDNGILYPVGRQQLLTKALKLLLTDEALKDKYIKAGRKRAEEFRPTYIIPKYLRQLNVPHKA